MSIPQVQKALVVPECSAAFDLQNVPVPRPKSGELLVRVKAAALNPADWKIQKHDPFSLKYPSVFGLDFAGEVVEAGENTLDFAVGDRVYVSLSSRAVLSLTRAPPLALEKATFGVIE